MVKDIEISQDEQLVKVRQWWAENGNSIIIGAVLGLSLIIGYNWWNKSKQDEAIEASGLFSQLVESFEKNDIKEINNLGSVFKNDYSSHDYAAKAVILVAIAALNNSNIDQAKTELNWVIGKSNSKENQLHASLLLAKQLFTEEKYDEALKLVDVSDKHGFESQYYELIGDIYSKTNNFTLAYEAYQKAIDTMLPETQAAGYKEILQIKLDNSTL